MRRPLLPIPAAATVARAAGLALALAGAGAVPAADVSFYGLIKERAYQQTNGTPALLATNAHGLTAFVLVATNGGAVSSAYLKPSTGAQTPLIQSTNSGNWFLSARFATESALNTAWPNTTDKLGHQAVNDGFRELNLNLSSGAYPNAPRVANFGAAQAIVATNSFPLQWDSFNGGTDNDLIQLVITDGQGNLVFSTPTYNQPNSLDGFSVSATIPAGTLLPGRAYVGNLAFTKIILSLENQLIYPNVPGGAAFAARTAFPLATVPRHATSSPTLRVISTDANAVTLRFNSEAGAAYRLLAATSLAAPVWTTLLTTNAASTNVICVDTNVAAAGERFYRVVSP
jgi:hypothetical protein